MRIKLDGNLGTRGVQLFRAAGHDVATVADEGLCAGTDRQIAAACRSEQRGQIREFRPEDVPELDV